MRTEDKLDNENILQYIIPKDLKDFGLIPEIIGRLPVLTHMNPLDKKTLRFRTQNAEVNFWDYSKNTVDNAIS